MTDRSHRSLTTEEIIIELDSESQRSLLFDENDVYGVIDEDDNDRRSAIIVYENLDEDSSSEEVSNVVPPLTNSEGKQVRSRSLSKRFADDDGSQDSSMPVAKRTQVEFKLAGGGGRRKSSEWENVKIVRNGTAIVSCRCLNCNDPVTAKVERIRDHLRKCKGNGIAKNSTSEKETLKKTLPACSPVPEKSVSVAQAGIKKFVDRISKNENRLLDLKLGRYIFGTNSSFNTVQNKDFQDFVSALRPAYQLPSHDVLGSRILNEVYEETIIEIKECLKNEKITLSQDGWSTIQRDPIISHFAITGSRSFFLDAICTGTNKKDASYCQHLLEEQIESVTHKYNCEVIGIVTDNENKMELLRANMKKNFPDLFVYGCNSHLLNLIGARFTPEELKDRIVLVQKFFRNRTFANQALKSIVKGLRPVIPGDTRWNSQIDCFESYKKNHTKYLEISSMKDASIESEIAEILNDSAIYDDLEDCLEVLKPIATSLDRLQREDATLAEAIHEWIKVEQKLVGRFPEQEKPYFLKQRSRAFTQPAIVAYMLHPYYRGQDLPEADAEAGRQWLLQKNRHFLVVSSSLAVGDSSFFPNSLLNAEVTSKMKPYLWWKCLPTGSNISADMIQLADSVLRLPASSSAIERCFSTMSQIMTKERNRLGIEKAMKLCTIYRQLQFQKIGDPAYRKEKHLN